MKNPTDKALEIFDSIYCKMPIASQSDYPNGLHSKKMFEACKKISVFMCIELIESHRNFNKQLEVGSLIPETYYQDVLTEINNLTETQQKLF